MKHSHIIYNPLTKSLLIDNSLKKDLEIAKKRNNKDKDNIQTIEMSESHGTQPYKKVKSSK
jgi:hypothetical protein